MLLTQLLTLRLWNIHARSQRLNCEVMDDLMRHLVLSKSIKLTIPANAIISGFFFTFFFVFCFLRRFDVWPVNVSYETHFRDFPEVLLRKGVLKICSRFTGEHPCWSAISIKLQATLLKSLFGMGVLL